MSVAALLQKAAAAVSLSAQHPPHAPPPEEHPMPLCGCTVRKAEHCYQAPESHPSKVSTMMQIYCFQKQLPRRWQHERGAPQKQAEFWQ
jgi:hypothetical protein